MKKVLAVFAVLMVLSACGKEVESKRFNTEKHDYNIRVIEDTETGVKYLFYQGDSGRGGLTKLEELDNMNGGKENE